MTRVVPTKPWSWRLKTQKHCTQMTKCWQTLICTNTKMNEQTNSADFLEFLCYLIEIIDCLRIQQSEGIIQFIEKSYIYVLNFIYASISFKKSCLLVKFWAVKTLITNKSTIYQIQKVIKNLKKKIKYVTNNKIKKLKKIKIKIQ